MTNAITAAFAKYAISLVLTQAAFFNEKLDWGYPAPITTNDLYYTLRPNPYGIDGALVVHERFMFSYASGRIDIIEDRYDSGKIALNRRWMEKLINSTNVMTTNEAIFLARDFLRRLNLDESELNLTQPPIIRQWKMPNGKNLPFFEVRWKEPPKFPGDDDDWDMMRMEISGVTRRVVRFNNNINGALHAPLPRDYRQIIGLPVDVNTNWTGYGGTNPFPRFAPLERTKAVKPAKKDTAPTINLSDRYGEFGK